MTRGSEDADSVIPTPGAKASVHYFSDLRIGGWQSHKAGNTLPLLLGQASQKNVAGRPQPPPLAHLLPWRSLSPSSGHHPLAREACSQPSPVRHC